MNFNNNDDDEDDALKEAQEEEYYIEEDGDNGEGGGGGTGMVIKALALAVCLLILGICFYFSWSSQEAKRKAEVARIQAMRAARLEGIEQKATEEDTKRLSITAAMQGRGMSITEMATGGGAAAAAANAAAAAVAEAAASYNVFDDLDDGDDDDSDISIEHEKEKDNDVTTTKTIPSGTNDSSTNKNTSPLGLYDEDDDEQFIDIEEPVVATAATPSMMEIKSNKTFSSMNKMTRRNSGSLFSQEESQEVILNIPTKNDDEDDVDEETKNRNEKKFYDLERERMNKEYYDKKVQAAKETLASPHDESLTPPSLKPPPIQTEPPIPKEPTRTEIPAVAASKLVQAVYDNPCAICLEAFVLESDDNIIFCSNVNTPHPFHQECSLDYLVSHVDGVAAPCPLCRQPFMYTQDHEEEAQGGGVLPSFPSSLSLASLLEAREEGAMISHPSSLSLKDLIGASEEKITISHPSSLSLTDLLRETAKADTTTTTTTNTTPTSTTNKTNKNSSVPLNIM